MIAFDILTKLCSEIQILRKQCVNILFQLGVFSDIQRKSYFCKSLIISTLLEQRNIMKYHFAILIIWRSLVQAQAGPQKNSSTYECLASAFSFLMERNSLAENRVSLSIFNYHTWIEYEIHTHTAVFNNICTPLILC